MGMVGVDDLGDPETAFKINESNFNRIFAEGSPDRKLMGKIFDDDP